MLARSCLWLLLLFAMATPLHAEQYLVRDQSEYGRAFEQIEAGDTIVLANGEWRDFELVVTGEGREGEPITVRAEQAGEVFLTGQSSLRIGGDYIVVSGLVFRDGYSPRGEVISFRRNADDLANNSRVTEVVIDHFSQPDRFESDYWVGIYGRNNRFDHNHMVGKTNQGVTLAVRLDSEESRDNHHRIDHNYFGPRPVLGSNGGETLRVGTSHYSMFASNTLVENNVFDRCNGEVEIISSKSGGNIFRGNLFLRSSGSLTLRHGDDSLIERNIFLGYGEDYTGGIRVINRNQTVRGNYMEGLRGTGFSSALTVMNGVPNSPVNRYVQVDNALIEHNTVVDSGRVTLGAGADEERSAPPVNSAMRANIFGGVDGASLISVDADISGISFADNILLGGPSETQIEGLETRAIAMVRAENGLLYPDDDSLQNLGAPRDLEPITLDQVGVAWYDKPGSDGPFGHGSVIEVSPGEDTLVDAIAQAGPGDTLLLAPGDYIVNRTLAIDKALTIRGAPAEQDARATLRFTRTALFELREGANLQLKRLVIDGELAPDSVGNSVIRTTSYPIQSNMEIELDDVSVRELVVNRSFNVLTLGKSTFAQRVSIRNSSFSNITGSVVSAAAETDDYGRYNVEYLDIIDSSFANVSGPVANIYRGGRDESTFGPFVTIAGNAFADVGDAAAGDSASAVVLHGAQTTRIARNALSRSAPLRIIHTVGTPNTSVTDNSFTQTPAPVVEELNYDGPQRVEMSGNTLDGVVDE